MKKTSLTAILATAALVVASCGSSYNRDDAIEDLVAEGIDRDTATCIIDGVEENFSVDRLESTGDLTQEEEEILTEITFECVSASLGG